MEAAQAPRWRPAAVLAACILAAGAASLWTGLDANWDLKNYHYYNAYAFLNGRLGWDIAPAQIQTYHNPLLDLPFYFLVNAIASPRVVAFVMAATTGIGAFFLLRIASALFPRGALEDRSLWVAAALAIGITGAGGRAVIASTMNEWPPAALLMAALALLAAPVASGKGLPLRALAISGLLAGAAVGLKLTYGVFGIALIASVGSFGTLRERMRRVVAVAGFVFAGFLITYCLWGAMLYREFGSPLFPYFNSIFRSPWWEPVAWFDNRFGPRNWWQAVAFPIFIMRHNLLTSEVSFRDYRLAVLLVLGAACLAKYVMQRRNGVRDDLPSEKSSLTPFYAWRMIAVFTIVAYLAWLVLFSYYRYLVPLEMLSGPMIVACAIYLVPGRNARRMLVVALAILLIATTRPADWGRLAFGDKYLDVSVPQLPANSLVIVGPYQPMAYAIAFFRPDARFVSPENNLLHLEQRNRLEARAAEIIATHAGPIFALDFRDENRIEGVLRHFGLARDSNGCAPIRSNLDDNAMRVCRVERLRR